MLQIRKLAYIPSLGWRIASGVSVGDRPDVGIIGCIKCLYMYVLHTGTLKSCRSILVLVLLRHSSSTTVSVEDPEIIPLSKPWLPVTPVRVRVLILIMCGWYDAKVDRDSRVVGVVGDSVVHLCVWFATERTITSHHSSMQIPSLRSELQQQDGRQLLFKDQPPVMIYGCV